ncbi:MAG: amidohydrolase family protein [Limisphaerales bacterium]
MKIIDANVHLFRWPFRRLGLDDTSALVAKLRSLGVVEAWAGSYEALLHRDLSAVNERLVTECRQRGEGILRPVGAINLSLPDWEEDLRRCLENYKMSVLRVYPNYHGTELSDPVFAKFLKLTASKALVQIAVMMEEERTQHPMMKIPHVNVTPLPALLKSIPKARVMLLNCFRAVRGKPLLELVATERVWFDISTLEGMSGIERMLKQIPANRIVFGTHAPLYLPESAVLKLRESELTQEQFAQITNGALRPLK